MGKEELKNEKFPGFPSDWDKNDFWMCPRMLDEYWCMLSGSEKGILVCILRKCFGWHKEWDYISQSQFRKYTGLSKGGVIDGVEGLERKGFIRISKTNYMNKYELVMSGNSGEDGSKSGLVQKLDKNGSKKGLTGTKIGSTGTKSVQTIDTNNKELNIDKNIDKIFSYYQKKINEHVELTDSTRKEIKKRLVEFNDDSGEVLAKAILCFSRNKYCMKKLRSLKPELFFGERNRLAGFLKLENDLGPDEGFTEIFTIEDLERRKKEGM